MFTLYNSPYAAHTEGRAVDLYPSDGTAPSPVSGTVLDVVSVTAPPNAYAEDRDYLIVVSVTEPAQVAEYTARILHVDPTVTPGDRVTIGDGLGRTIRSGYFAPWVDDHLHVGFRDPDADPYRASGSIPLSIDVPVEAMPWNGHGTVIEQGETYVLLDRPAHPKPGRGFAGIGATTDTDGADTEKGGEPHVTDAVVDGGYPHYDGGGVIPTEPGGLPTEGPVRLLGEHVGTASGRTVTWADRRVLVDGDPVLGLSLYVGRDRAGAKVICPDREFDIGQSVAVDIASGGA